MNRGYFLLLVALLFATVVSAQRKTSRNLTVDVMSVGVGVGFDHGGIGANALLFPIDNLGFFIGAGYAVAGFAVNAGSKYRLTNFSSKYHPFFSIMYGHNVLITTTNSENKLFYGFTPGVGIDIHPQWAYNYFSFAILAPIQGTEVKEYLDTKPSGVSFKTTSVPISFSVGYRFGIK